MNFILGMLNGLLGFDPNALAAAAGAGVEMDADMAEKLAAMSASMNMMEDMQMRNKALEEIYGRIPASSGFGESSAPSTSTKEPGETSPSVSKQSRKSATVTKHSNTSNETAGDEEQPEDLSLKPKAEGDSASAVPSTEGRTSRESDIGEGSVGKADRSGAVSKTSDNKEAPVDNVEGRNSVISEGRHSRTSHRAVSASPQPLSRPTSEARSHSSHEGQNNQSEKSRPESPSSGIS